MFEGLIALREPSKSWIARWQRIDGFKKGMYAVKVSGNVSFPEVDGLKRNGRVLTGGAVVAG